MKVYEVALVGYDTHFSYGMFLKYDTAVAFWDERRIEMLTRYKEYDAISRREEPPVLWDSFNEHIYVFSAETPPEHKNRRTEHQSIDAIYIIEHNVNEE